MITTWPQATAAIASVLAICITTLRIFHMTRSEKKIDTGNGHKLKQEYGERLVAVEVEMRNVKEDTGEIKMTLNALFKKFDELNGRLLDFMGRPK